MDISLKWLQKYVDISGETLMHDLSIHTSEVEEERQLGKLPHVVIGQVTNLEQHPDADKLRVATVDTGDKESRQIVCGATNLENGHKVPVALPGAVLGEDFEIKEAKLRGVLSQGMICSEDELGFTKERQPGIMVLPEDAPIGTPISTYLEKEDLVLEIENKSITNRPDLFGHYGIARECALIYKKDLGSYLDTFIENNTALPKLNITIEDPSICKRYIGVQIDNITPKESPLWLKNALEAVGQRPRNTIVDITNYVMMDLGQPMHAFDTDKLEHTDIHIGFAKAQEVETLLGNQVTTEEHHLLIKDKETPIAIAGIMGLENSCVTEDTKSIILESATFDYSPIRKASRELGIRTDSSVRFEKQLDPEFAMLGMQKALSMIMELHPEAQISSQITDHFPSPYPATTITTSLSFLEMRLGEAMGKERILEVLEGLGFQVEETGDHLSVKVPSWRNTGDISIPEDLVEELARFFGYNDFQGTLPSFPMAATSVNNAYQFKRTLRRFLATKGMIETLNYDFYSKEMHEKARLNGKDIPEPIAVLNPISTENELMRLSMIPRLIEDTLANSKYRKSFAAFEIGTVYPSNKGDIMDKEGYKSFEKPRLGLITSSLEHKESDAMSTWENHPFYHLKHIVESVIKHLQTKEHISYERPSEEDLTKAPWVHPNKSMVVKVNGRIVGIFGELHPAVAHAFNAKQIRIACGEFNLDQLESLQGEVESGEIASMPAVYRDASFVLDEKGEVGPLLDLIKGTSDIIEEVSLTDLYQGEHVESGKKSVTTSISFVHPKKTLTDEAVNHIMQQVFLEAEKKLGASIRS